MGANMKLGTKFAVGFGAIILLMLIMSVNSYYNLYTSREDLQQIQQANERMDMANDVIMSYKDAILGLRGYAVYGDAAMAAQMEEGFNRSMKRGNDLLAVARQDKKADVQTLINETTQYKDTVIKEYMPIVKAYHEARAAGNGAQAQVYAQQMTDIAKRLAPLVKSVGERGEKIAANNAALAKTLVADSTQRADRVNLISGIFSLVILLLGLTIAVILTRAIKNPVLALTGIANEYAAGNLCHRIQPAGSDEIGELAGSLGRMHDNFVEMISGIRTASEQLSQASEQMAASTEEVTAGSEEISRSMQHLAGEADSGNRSMLEASQSLVQLSSLIQIAKSKVDNTSQKSQETLRAAENGRSRVTESVDKMTLIAEQTRNSSQIIAELNEYSQQISRITDTITGIANQTDLLALNAAIESARAGEHGRGFAVVAEEVRKLAEQSNQGAKEITALVQKVTDKTSLAVESMARSVTEVENGVATVHEAGEALDNILQSARIMVDETRNIGDVTSDQVASSEQIVQLIDRLSSMVETVAAHGEEVSASSQQQTTAMETIAAGAEETNAMANQMKELVQRFHTAE
ncbi:MAG TPA: methyl-accepting chemotaxis protein [Patescibacteria group bacterium]|nr:methyl-accepting chemotaxis protein [Patescibacteria group bacterium]